MDNDEPKENENPMKSPKDKDEPKQCAYEANEWLSSGRGT